MSGSKKICAIYMGGVVSWLHTWVSNGQAKMDCEHYNYNVECFKMSSLQEIIKFRIPALLLSALVRGQIGDDHPPNSRPVNLFDKLQL